jgi:hypothetical protein
VFRDVKGRIVMPTRPVAIGGAVATGAKPGLIVYVRSGSGRLMRKFHRFCAQWGIAARPVQEVVTGEPDAWEVIGTVESLEALLEHDAVVRWHYIMAAKPPMGAAGGGSPDGANVKRALRDQRTPKADRLAREETERRAKLPAELRDDIELAEIRQRPGYWPA